MEQGSCQVAHDYDKNQEWNRITLSNTLVPFEIPIKVPINTQPKTTSSQEIKYPLEKLRREFHFSK